MHVPHDREHGLQHVVVDMDDHVDTVVERDKLGIGDDRGDLDERVVR